MPSKPIKLPEGLLSNELLAQPAGDNLKIYTGSCQCGAVAFAVRTPPLSQVSVREDNCSICVRRAATSIYPTRDKLVIVGEDRTTMYGFGRAYNRTPFCATCGVACYVVLVGPPREIYDGLPAERRAAVERMRWIRPLYVRAMEGVEWDEITVERSDEGTEGYVVPEE